MATTYTTNTNLQKPALNDTGWNTPINANADQLDAVAAVGNLAVALHEVPSSSLNVKVSAGSFVAANGTVVAYAGTASQAMTTAATNYVYMTDAGVLTVNTTGFPTTSQIVRLAIVVAGATTITSVTDARVPFRAVGLSRLQVADGSNKASGVATLVGGTVVVSNTLVTANSRIQLTAQSAGGTPGALYVSARTAGTSFTITSTSGTDTSVAAWLIVEPS